jgi:dTDP-glucose 4,6-dehydratase
MQTILVTGGCGFIGSHFVRLLISRTGWRVVNLDKLTYAGTLENVRGVQEGERYRFVRGDIGDRGLVDSLFREEHPSAVVNFAAESHVDRSILDSSPFLETNIGGVQILLEASRRHSIERFVQISTDEVYGDAEGKEPRGEESLLAPSSPYAASKAAADLLCLAYRRTYGTPVLIVRSSNNYGPFQFPEKLIPLVIRNALGGEDIPLYGDGLQRREWLYVDDNVEAILRVLERGESGAIYNVGSAEERTNLEVIHRLCSLLSEEARLDLQSLLKRIQFVLDRPGHDRRYALKADRIRKDLGWEPAVPFETGLRKTVRWHLQNKALEARGISEEYLSYYEAVYSRAWGQSSS